MRAPLLGSLGGYVSLASLVSIAACSRASSAPDDAAPSRPSSSTSTPPATPAPLAPPRSNDSGGLARRRLNLTCRAMAVAGAPRIEIDGGAKPLGMNDLADGWVTLGTAADTVTVTLPRTGRELTFLGPARVEPCVGTDEAWVSHGRFQGAHGSGESPGAEQWVVTPFGIVRYGSAIVEVEVEDTFLRASLKGGSATILPEGATTWESLLTDAGAGRVVKGAPVERMGSPANGSSIASAVRCAQASAASNELQNVLLLPDAAASPTFGNVAMRANDANVLARAACAIAKLRADPAGLTPRAAPRPR